LIPFETDSNGEEVRVEGSYCIFQGVVTSSTTIGSVSKLFGTAQNYSAGATTRVYITVSSYHNKRLIEGLLAEHTNPTGYHALTTNATITSSKFITSLNDTNGNELIKVTPTASAVNEITLANAATGAGPTISATGDDTNIDLNFAAKGTGKLKGIVNNLNIPNKFFAYRNAAQNSVVGFTKLNFDTELFDTGSNYDNATNFRFTAPIAGFYSFSGNVTATNTELTVGVYKNGTIYIGFPNNTSAISATGTRKSNAWKIDCIQLAQNDYIEVFAACASITGFEVGSTPIFTFFCGELISAT
jgi:hypothetical protein